MDVTVGTINVGSRKKQPKTSKRDITKRQRLVLALFYPKPGI